MVSLEGLLAIIKMIFHVLADAEPSVRSNLTWLSRFLKDVAE